MSFLTAIPEELLSAAAQLEGIGTSLTAQNAGAAAPTTTIAPAAIDPVSLPAGGTVRELRHALPAARGRGPGHSTAVCEHPGTELRHLQLHRGRQRGRIDPRRSLHQLPQQLQHVPWWSDNSVGGNPLSPSGNLSNFGSFETGNWASAMSDVLGMAGGGLLPAAASDTGDAAGAAAGAADAVERDGAGRRRAWGAWGPMAAMPVANVGQATMVGKLSVPPSWAGSVTPGATPVAAVQTVGWTAAAPQAGPGTIVPGMPGMGAAARNSAGFGAPRYGVKPIVMPKPTAV